MKILKILETVKNFIKKNKKLVTVVSAMFCAVVLVAGSIAGTIAYLTSTAQVTNTFTVGNVKITMVESLTNEYGEKTSGTTDDGNEYKIIPGHTYAKDPKITVENGSEDCYLFVKVVNGISTYEVGAAVGDTIAEQLEANGWKLVAGKTDVWYYAKTNPNGDSVTANTEVPTFATFTVANDADVTSLSDAQIDALDIIVTAYAIQSNGLTDANAAWTAGGWS